FSRWKMRRRIEMGAVVFQHPEAAREVAVFFDRAIRSCFKYFWVAGPGDKFVVDGVAQINNACFSRQALPERQRIAVWSARARTPSMRKLAQACRKRDAWLP